MSRLMDDASVSGPTARPDSAPVGRPRSGSRHRPGGTPREEILDAAAELFTHRGYAATSTRMIAEAVGIRQASLYYHVSNKEELLAELLTETVRPSVAFAARLTPDPNQANGDPDDAAKGAAAQLFALAAYDTGVLCGGRWNLGALYLLPEVRGERFARFRADRATLRAAYDRLITAAGHHSGEPAEPGLTDLVFGLVESVIQIRSEREITDVDALARQVATGCLRLIGIPPAHITEIARSVG